MASIGISSLLKNRKLESSFSTGFAKDSFPHSPEKTMIRDDSEHRTIIADGLSVDDDDGWMAVLISWARLVMCFVLVLITTSIWTLIMVILIPWPCERIKQSNVFGHVSGRMLMWLLGNPVKIEGAEHANERAIYICNHASPLDIVLTMWLTPKGTVCIAKKEIVWYPLIGQLYALAGHLRIDRSNPVAAIQSMKEVARAVVKNDLSLIIFPEGTRSKDGRLLPFKKGFVHLALQTRRPIVPIVLTGTHMAWRKGSLHIRPTPLTVKYLPPIVTTDWTPDRVEDYTKMIHDIYVNHLPESQQPLRPKES
uniref:1-acyl-sn-glycerol-3-phosphate acyltransferase n=1 Tax=Cuphea avigera var. pulcherrima TaxID=83566 RepID=A0A0S1TJH5_9MYRT|nr:microsomal class B lysophosphatidic acid acyltransferase [Cuphea avigera var. pulcherrima]